jgi:hypothetical protein
LLSLQLLTTAVYLVMDFTHLNRFAYPPWVFEYALAAPPPTQAKLQ